MLNECKNEIMTTSATDAKSANLTGVNTETTTKQIGVDDLMCAQVVISPLDPDYAALVAKRQIALDTLAAARIYPMPPAVFYWLHYRPELSNGQKAQTAHNRLLGVGDAVPAPPPPAKPRTKAVKPRGAAKIKDQDDQEKQKRTNVNGKRKRGSASDKIRTLRPMLHKANPTPINWWQQRIMEPSRQKCMSPPAV